MEEQALKILFKWGSAEKCYKKCTVSTWNRWSFDFEEIIGIGKNTIQCNTSEHSWGDTHCKIF